MDFQIITSTEKAIKIKRTSFYVCLTIAGIRVLFYLNITSISPVFEHVLFWNSGDANVDYIATVAVLLLLMVEVSVVFGFIYNKIFFLYLFALLNILPALSVFEMIDVSLTARVTTFVISFVAILFAILGMLSIRYLRRDQDHSNNTNEAPD